MWNKFLGKGNDPVGAAATGGPSVPPAAGGGNNDAIMTENATHANSGVDTPAGIGGGAPPSSAAINAPAVADNTANNDNAAAAAPPVAPAVAPALPNKKTLSAVTYQGTKWNVRISVNKQNITPPVSAAEDNDDGMMDEDGLDGGQQDIERSFSGSTKTSSTNNSMDHEPSSDVKKPTNTNNTNESMSDIDEDDNNEGNSTGTRRGRSASIGNEQDDLGQGGFSRDNSSSSEVAAASGGANAGGGTGAGVVGEVGTNFEASLLLGIAEFNTQDSNATAGSAANSSTSGIAPEKEKREPIDPTTLPTSMTSFLDMLTEDQRRVRHRHIPGVDGFRKLYKSEVKSDMSEARRLKRKVKDSSRESGRDGMEVDGENEQDDNASTAISEEDMEENKMPDRDAFVVPDKETMKFALGGQFACLLEGTDFENAIKSSNGTIANSSISAASGSGSGPATLKSPRLVDSLTSFNPPRPQESTAPKTHHRLKRWQANPPDISADLLNYRKTVSRTRAELNLAKKEMDRVESVASLVRMHFMGHLNKYKQEVTAVNEGLQEVNGRCIKLEEVYNGRMSTRKGSGVGGKGGRGMKDVFGTLKSLGEEIKGVAVGAGSAGLSSAGLASATGAGVGGSAVSGSGNEKPPKDWRGMGVGGVTSSQKDAISLASGWFLLGDEVIVIATGEEGTIVSVNGPNFEASDKASLANKNKKDATLSGKDLQMKKKGSASSSKGGDDMDVDTPSKDKTNTAADTASSKKIGTTIGVKLAKYNQIRTYSVSQLKFNPKKIPALVHLSDANLAKRWENMVATAVANGVNHDVLAMEEYINSSFAQQDDSTTKDTSVDSGTASSKEGTKDDDDNGKCPSPKSVTHYEDDRSLLPFGSGLIAAPSVVKNYPSVISLDHLEETVRKVVYEADKPRVMPTMSPALLPYESRSEEINQLKGKVLQLRNRLGRQKRLRNLNERSLEAGKGRSLKVEGLLVEMQMDLKVLKERLEDELNELGIGNSPITPTVNPENENDGANDKNETEIGITTTTLDQDDGVVVVEVPKQGEEEKSPIVSSHLAVEKADTTTGSDNAAPPDDDKLLEADSKVLNEGIDEAPGGDAGAGVISEVKPLPESKKEEVTITADNSNLPGLMPMDDSADNDERESKRARVEE
eukprot:CAMPEP_0172318422 /NCGR_PEP_ID=MMETSP1058-20130122/34814_1 /TAXON_ID=83371 /ORGANISM="Detonula confervacea, Strain CCMP 353" /LENGTH=1146 /DNA_ID=CAMNT_0013033253 /DNA_START=171 /DNA_END=3611 /DNA_ORIENTATION=+